MKKILSSTAILALLFLSFPFLALAVPDEQYYPSISSGGDTTYPDITVPEFESYGYTTGGTSVCAFVFTYPGGTGGGGGCANYSTFLTGGSADMETLSGGVDGTWELSTQAQIGSPPYPVIFYARFTRTGGVWTGESAPIPGDDASNTHVIRINTPVDYATTTSPATFDFDAMVADADAPGTDGYVIQLYEEGTGDAKKYVGLLPAYATGTPFNVSTTTISWPRDSAMVALVYLVGGAQEYIDNGTPLYGSYTLDSGRSVLFAYGSSYSSVSNPKPTVLPYEGPTAVASDCSINFLGSFSLNDCITYLVQPASTTQQAFSQITLENRLPFAYAYDIGQLRNEFFGATHNGTTTIAVTVPGFGTITFLSAAMIAAVPFSGTIKAILAALIWLIGAEFIYYTVIRSHNNQTGV